jgi:Zn-dependent protease
LNLGLAFFNILPIPPLDGFRVAAYFLPPEVERFCLRFQILFFILLLVIMRQGYFGGILGRLRALLMSLIV